MCVLPHCRTCTYCLQLRELLLKYWLVYWRTPSYTLARCFLTLCVAFIYGSMYFKAAVLPKPYATMGNVQNIMGIMFSSTSFLGMTNLMAVMPLVGECCGGGDQVANQSVEMLSDALCTGAHCQFYNS